MRYWDTSALSKLCFPEADSAWYLSELGSASEPAFTSEIAEVELYSTLWRKERDRSLVLGEARLRFALFESFCRRGTIILAPCDVRIIEESKRIAAVAYGQVTPILIRSLDLIHVASASVVRADMIVSADKRMRAVASVLNMKVLPEAQ